ncbi:MAG: HD domain-containing phosphohydrolase [Candidatus Omnitrophota bacterium]|nr:HD domain-containing protein [Candidatus Omnitrophota bacterium]MBU1929098.1 HD domain-containing protein [Candidatus Omnitrophota bacterium]MBU1929151.1 HD domain-containing protein [Candidatus Omnitrophota bacterium]MBU2035031.1 HD domain-containing protein [Candidatus Omnitrophota bacterium]MBU2222026.1 HD domain-containing protein [Candidatus Omnitrophota bacterium]
MNTKNYLIPTKRYKTLISSIHSIYRLVNSTFELNDLIIRLSRLICQIFDSQHCMILILDSSKKHSIFKCVINNKKKTIIDKKHNISARLEKRIIAKLSVVRNDHCIGLPLIGDDIVGVVVLKRSKKEPAFDNYDQEILMTLLEQAMIAIKNLQLYEEQQKTVFGSIKSLVMLLDMRVPQGYTHSPYFSRLVAAIAGQLHLDQKQIESLKYASLLHDAGKIDIPIEILTKTTKLTPQEYSIIKRHPVMGAQILRPLQILRPAIPIIMHHHEKYNGTGYPSKLKKGQIPLGARVMAVADAFEAMVYGRPYRERINIDLAIREIKKKSGTQFDPKIVEAFLKISKKMAKKYLQFNR